MKKFKIVLFAALALAAAGCEKEWDKSQWPEIPRRPDPMPNTGNYRFSDGVMSEEVLHNYLSRAITQTEFLSDPATTTDGVYGTQDDERMLLNVGAKFIGRAMYQWNREANFLNDAWFSGARAKIDRMHAQDPDLVFQAALFETVSTRVNDIPVPAWVFQAFGKEPEERNFRFEEIRDEGGLYWGEWGENTCVPDMSREEAQMWFYFMAVKYMEAGIEAFHCGQVRLMASMGDSDNDYAGYRNLLSKIREAAKTRAARGTVIMDAHLANGGIVVDGRHLFDFVSFPLRPKEIVGEPVKAKLEKGYLDSVIGYTQGGETPSGWTADRIPYILEFDNFGVSSHPGAYDWGDHFVWGYDEISWFGLCDDDYARYWLEYAVDYMNRVDPVGYIQMPGCRISISTPARFYRCNTRSEATPTGRSTEETIKKIWSTK